MKRQDLTQLEVAQLIEWTQSKVAQKLTGRTPITLEELSALCFALGIQPTEAVRDRGLEFCAELVPHELRLLENFRRVEPRIRESIAQLLDFKLKQHKPERSGPVPDRSRLVKKG
jgi:transcriptional regulator with XRE-family HTH domain